MPPMQTAIQTGAGQPPAAAPAPGRLRVAYLVNRYPRTSHSFIRREIRALESLGVEVLRFSQQPLDEELATPADREELERTRVILSAGTLRHAWAVLACAARRPGALARAAATALRLGRRSDRGVLLHLVYLAEACLLEAWLRRSGAHHLHAHFGTNSATVAMLCHALGGPPFSFTVHGPDEFDKPEFLGMREKIAQAAFVVAISSYGRAQLCRWSRFEDWPKIQVVHCGLDRDLLDAPPSPPPVDPRLVCVARLGEQKGHLLLVEAAERLAADGLRFTITLVGDGPLRAALEERVRRAGLGDRIRFAGWVSGEGVRDEILRSRALVLPSFAEGLPVVIMEALALGRPVVTTAIAGIPELVEPGVNGWVVPAGSAEALVPALRAALEAPPAQLEAMGRAGAARVRTSHDAVQEAGRLLALFAKSRAPERESGLSPRPSAPR